MAQELIYKINFDGAEASTKQLADLKKQLADLTDQQKANKKAIKDLDTTSVDYEENLKTLYAEQVKLEAQTKTMRSEVRLAETAYLANANASTVAGGSIKQLSAELSKNKQAYQNLSKEERENDKIGGELLRTIQAQDAEYKELQVSIGNNQVMVGSYQDAVNSLLPVMGGLGGQIQGVIGTLGQIKDAFSKVGAVVGSQRAVIKGFGSSTQTSSDQVEGMTASLGNATASTIGFGQAQSISTGATATAERATIGFNKAQASATVATQTATNATRAQTVATKSMAVATNTGSNALKLFKIALISTGIGAIVVALGSLIAAFASTQRGADAIAKALGPVKEIFAVFVGFLQDKALAIFDRLKEAINNPKQAFQDLLGFVKDVVINRFKGLQMFFEGWGNTFVGSWQTLGLKLKKVLNNVPIIGAGLSKEALEKLDKDIATAEKKVMDGAQKMKKGLAQATGMDAMVEGFNKAGKAMDEASKRDKRMQNLRIEIEQLEAREKLEVARLERRIKEEAEIRRNTSATDAERKRAALNEIKLLEQQKNIQDTLLAKRIQLMELSQMANDTNRKGNKELNDLMAQREQIEADFIMKKTKTEQELNAQEKEALANAQKLEDERKKKQAEADAQAKKTELENAKAVAKEKIAEAEFEHKKKMILFNGTKEQEYEMEVAHQKTISDLKLKYAKIAGENELDVKRENEMALLEMAKAEMERKKQEEKEQAEKQKEVDKTELDTKKAKRNAQIDLAKGFADEALKIEQQRIERTQKREIDSLNLRRQAGEISQEEYEKKRLEIEKEAFRKKKNADTKQVIVNAVVAASKITAQSGVGAPLFLALLAAQTAGQVAQIQAQKFRFGGNVGGQLHSNGGTMIEAERGEAVIMREAVNPVTAPILSAINTAYGGNPIQAIGGMKATAQMPMQQQRIKVVNVATETSAIANRVKNLQNSRRF